jgi:hypothetical protein
VAPNVIPLELPQFRLDQWEIVSHPAKRKCLAMGRRWGKSVLATCVAIPLAAGGARVAWCVPNYKNGRPLWRVIEQTLKPLEAAGLCKINKSERTVQFTNGGFLGLYSMSNPDSIRGENFHLVIVDEAAMVSEEAWTDCIQPTLADQDGDTILISTPKGRNWFWKEYQAGLIEMEKAKKEKREPVAASWSAPTRNNPNPNIQKAADLAKGRISESSYRQEWLAEFLEDGGSVFRNVQKCCTAKRKTPYMGDFVGGLDWGKQNDWTVLIIMDAVTGEVVDWVRFNQISWRLQRGKVKTMFDKWRPHFILAEWNSIGDPNIEALQDEGMPVVPFYTTGASKGPLIESLVLSFEREEIAGPNDGDAIHELEAYEMEKNPKTGRITYNAPEVEGMHDDWVVSLAIADWARIHFEQYIRALLSGGMMPGGSQKPHGK